MCGIFCILNNSSYFYENQIINNFNKGINRGPENSTLINIDNSTIFGFHRLAINGLDDISNQPIVIDEITLICNGEIYNYKELYSMIKDIEPKSSSDCEIIIHLYKKYGIEQTLKIVDGVFSFILIDNKKNEIYVARDPFGVRPLYYIEAKDVKNEENIIIFASELKVLSDFYKHLFEYYEIKQFKPSTYSKYVYKNKSSIFNFIKTCKKWFLESENIIYHTTSSPNFVPDFTEEYNIYNIQIYLKDAVRKRVNTTDRPIGCLLSGGLDSSLITALTTEIMKENGCKEKLNTFSIGMEGSEDLKNAKIVSEYLDTNHFEIVLTEEEFFNSIPEVIQIIESYDTTSVRASIGNYLIGKYISKNTDIKVVLNGDGSDELMGGYLYMHHAPDSIEFDKESRRLLKDIHFFDVLRSDKSISSNGLEPRTPFLDKSFVNYYLSINPNIRNHNNKENNIEKYLLRKAFSSKYYLNNNRQLLPDSILWRSKVAFSDGVSGQKRFLFQMIKENVELKYKISENEYYKKLFDLYYPNCDNIVPYLWKHRFIISDDPSATTLKIYKKIKEKI